MNNNIINATEQMELGFNGQRTVRPGRHQRTRIERAAWWFAKMRNAVDAAMDWEPAGDPRPQQLWINQTQRQIGV